MRYNNSYIIPAFSTIVLSFLTFLSLQSVWCCNAVNNSNNNNNYYYVVETCLAETIGAQCEGNTSLQAVQDLRVTRQEARSDCEETEGQEGSVTYVDLVLPPNKVLLVEVTTKVGGQDSRNGFFVRPTRKTRYWGKAEVFPKKASFYLADTRQFSVEFASNSIWRNKKDVEKFDALMLFVNPQIDIPTKDPPLSPSSQTARTSLKTSDQTKTTSSRRVSTTTGEETTSSRYTTTPTCTSKRVPTLRPGSSKHKRRSITFC